MLSSSRVYLTGRYILCFARVWEKEEVNFDHGVHTGMTTIGNDHIIIKYNGTIDSLIDTVH